MHSRTLLSFWPIVLLAFIHFAHAEDPVLSSNDLKEFVAKKDDAFRFEVLERGTVSKCRWLRVHMVSQHWKETDWKHVVWILAPESWINSKTDDPAKPSLDSAMLLISGGSWPAEWGEKSPEKMEPKGELRLMAAAAEATNCPAVIISQVPFQPMMGNRHEDALIAETFRLYLSGEGNDWPLLMPMVRAAVRAMDAAQSIANDEWKHPIHRFTVTGASKRGWTTWLTSAVDPRVDALAPMVIDMLNMPIQMKHQVATWGTYSEQIEDYTKLQLPKYLATPTGVALQRIVDPFRYRKQLTQPKLLIFGTNDRYWPLDACNLYWNDLESTKYLLYVPNQPHGIADYQRLVGGLCALHRSRTGQGDLPKLDWRVKQEQGKHTLTMNSDIASIKAELWQAKAETRDFRNSEWTATDMNQTTELRHTASVEPPAKGYSAFFGDWTFQFESGLPFHLTTNVQIVEPDAN
jgi:PhoPQ-activated pathogenicity-related protein